MAREGTGVLPEFVRLFHGRLWHVARPRLQFAGAEEDVIGAAFCGESWPLRGDRRPEVLAAQIPDGGALCVRCVAEVNAYRNVVLGVGTRDRRQVMRELWPTLLDSYDDVVDAEIVEDDDGMCIECPHSLDDHGPTGCLHRDDGEPLDGPCPCQYAVG